MTSPSSAKSSILTIFRLALTETNTSIRRPAHIALCDLQWRWEPLLSLVPPQSAKPARNSPRSEPADLLSDDTRHKGPKRIYRLQGGLERLERDVLVQ